MYTALNIVLAFGSLALFIYGCVVRDWSLITPGILIYFLFPLVFEPLINIFGKLSFSKKKYNRLHLNKHEKFGKLRHPLVYHPEYNVTACKLEKIHPFDSCKYGRVISFLKTFGVIESDAQIHKPSMISRALLSSVHGYWYLFTLCYSINVCRIIEVPVIFLPACILRWRVLDPMLLATQGTIDAACIALEKKWAINIGGGFHHASASSGGGFCVYADITLAIKHLRRYHNEKVQKVMIVDLDAHQGNGYERDFLDDEHTFIVDFYNHYIYPNDVEAKRAISVDITIANRDDDEVYLGKLKKVMPEAVNTFKPDFVLYNAGTDCLKNDPLGNLNITQEGIIERDEIVFRNCIQNNIPIMMVLSGGYQKENAESIAKSVKNLYDKFNFNSELIV